MENKTHIKVYITKTNKFRAKIYEPDKPAYEVTVGGISWKEGKGKPFQAKILDKCRGLFEKMKKELFKLSNEY